MHTDNRDGNLPLHVILSYGPLGLVRAVPRQLRYDGMTVDTGVITLDEQAEVELSFTHRLHDEFVTHRLRARVSASSRGTAVLTFSDYARSTWDVLQRLVEGDANDTGYTRSLPHLHVPNWLAAPLPPGSRFA